MSARLGDRPQLEHRDDVTDVGPHLLDVEGVDRLAAKPDRQVNLGWHLHLGIRRLTDDAKRQDLCAVVEWPLGRGSEFEVSPGWLTDTKVARLGKPGLHYPMLVGVAELSEQPQRIRLLPTGVWLKPIDDCPVRVGYTSKQTFSVAPCPTSGVIVVVEEDREASAVGLGPRERIDEMVEGRAKIADRVASDCAEFQGWLSDDCELHDVPAALDLQVRGEAIRVGTHEGVDLAIEGLEVLGRAPQLQAGTFQMVGHDASMPPERRAEALSERNGH